MALDLILRTVQILHVCGSRTIKSLLRFLFLYPFHLSSFADQITMGVGESRMREMREQQASRASNSRQEAGPNVGFAAVPSRRR
jgi:hypothetical protein